MCTEVDLIMDIFKEKYLTVVRLVENSANL